MTVVLVGLGAGIIAVTLIDVAWTTTSLKGAAPITGYLARLLWRVLRAGAEQIAPLRAASRPVTIAEAAGLQSDAVRQVARIAPDRSAARRMKNAILSVPSFDGRAKRAEPLDGACTPRRQGWSPADRCPRDMA